MKKKTLVILALVCACTWIWSSQGFGQTRWKMATSWPKGTILQECAEDFASMVSAMSGGELEIKCYAAGELMEALEVMEGVQMGSIDAAHCSPSYQVGKLPAGPLFGYTPFGMTAVPFLTWMYEGEGFELYQELYSRFKLGYAAPCGILPTENLAWSNTPIKSMDDFKGLKFRTSGYWGEILNNAGSSVVMLPAGEVYEALQRKVIDAGEFSIPSMDKDLAFYEIARYLLLPGVHQPSTILDITVNKRSWDALSPEQREVIKVAAKATTMQTLTKCINKDMHALEFFQDKEVEIEYLDPKIQKALKEETEKLMEAKAKKDSFFAKVWESQKEFRKKYGTYESLMTVQTEE